jgi:hypothetical protein
LRERERERERAMTFAFFTSLTSFLILKLSNNVDKNGIEVIEYTLTFYSNPAKQQTNNS